MIDLKRPNSSKNPKFSRKKNWRYKIKENLIDCVLEENKKGISVKVNIDKSDFAILKMIAHLKGLKVSHILENELKASIALMRNES